LACIKLVIIFKDDAGIRNNQLNNARRFIIANYKDKSEWFETTKAIIKMPSYDKKGRFIQ